MGNKLEKNAALLGLGAFLLLMFAVTITVVVPMLQGDLYVAEAAAPQYNTEAAALGRKIYMREGCFYCHTQQVRTLENDSYFRAPATKLKDGTVVGNRPTRPGDYANDNPALLGTERTGPDLKYVAHRWPSKDWHIAHLIDPRSTEPNSIMPSFAHLPSAELDALAEYLLSLRDWSIPIVTMAKYPGKNILDATDELIPDEYKGLQNPYKPGDSAALARAEQLIKEKGCLACHGQDMRGKDTTKGWAAAPFPTDWYKAAEKQSEQFLFWIVSEGTLKEDGTKSGMPAWRQNGVSDEDRWALVTYIKNLKGK
ncbi:MAG TPA: cbb3-type cytochrome c oxidase subunit II [Symbiobacteriaceae bacterium]|nr:cbb3-type cytochrome c oxidase subunit II [Symbiobacteriaceae bacterium]